MLLYLLFEQAGAEAVCSANETSTGSEIILFSKPGSSDNENSKTELGPVTKTYVTATDDPLLPGTHNERRQILDPSSTNNLWDFISTITLLPDPTSEEIWASVTVTTGVFEGSLSLETLTLSLPDTSALQESEEITTFSQLLTTITSSAPLQTTFSSATDEASSSITVAPTTAASNGSSGLGAGEIAGIVVGGLVGFVAVAISFLILAIFLRRRRRQRHDEHPNIQLVSGPFPDPTERRSQEYIWVRPINPRPDLMMNEPTISEPAGPRLSGGSRGSGSAARPSEPGPSGVASGEEVSRDTIDAIIDGYSSSVYSQ